MKRLLIGLVILGSISSFAGHGAFIYNGEILEDNTDQALFLFNDMKSAETSSEQVDICYYGDWTIAQDSFTDILSFSILDVGSSGELNVQIYNPNSNALTYGIIPVCD